MKLFTKYNRINIFATVGIFLLASGAFYFLLRYIIIDQVDQDLRIEENEIETSVKTFHKLPDVIPVHDQYTTFTPISSPSLYRKEFLTFKKYEAHEHENILIRQIAF